MTLFELTFLAILVFSLTFAFVLAFAGLKLLKQLVDKNICHSIDYLDLSGLPDLISNLQYICEDKIDKIDEKNDLYNKFGKK